MQLVSDITGFPRFEIPDEFGDFDASFLEQRGPCSIWFGLRLTVRCEHCQAQIALDGFSTSAVCCDCGHSRVLNQAFWAMVFDHHDMHTALCRAQAVGGETPDIETRFRARARRMQPHCHECGQALTDDALDCGMAGQTTLCGSCGADCSLRAAGPLAMSIASEATWIASEGPVAIGDQSTDEAQAPVVVDCDKCQAALKLDGKSRRVQCEFCDAENYLPDALWLRLHPKKVAREFYLLVCFDEVTYWRWFFSSENRADDVKEYRYAISPLAKRVLAEEPWDDDDDDDDD